MTTRVAITGVGLVTALGATREESWRRMLAGECGIRPTTCSTPPAIAVA